MTMQSRIGLVILFASSWPGVACAQESKPQSAAIGSRLHDDAVLQSWAERNLLDAYRRVGRHSSACDPTAEGFIRDSIPSLIGLAPGGTRDLIGRGRELVKAGCDDALVQFLTAQALTQDDVRSREASELYEQAFAAMPQAGYPRAVAWLAALGLRLDLDRRNDGIGKRQAVDPLELRFFLEGLGDGSFVAGEDVALLRPLHTWSGRSMLHRNSTAVAEAVARASWVAPWARDLVEAERQIDAAWTARGDEFADKVTPAGWKGFEESLARARVAYMASWQARPDRPEAATGMLQVVKARRQPADDSVRTWFERAVAAQFDYLPAYSAMISASRPSWGGSREALLEFARECYATRRFDTEVPLIAFKAIQQVELEARWAVERAAAGDAKPKRLAASAYPPSVYREPAVLELVRAVLDGYLRGPASRIGGTRIEALYAAVEYQAGHHAEARGHLRRAGGVLTGDARAAIFDDLPEARIEAWGAPNGAEVARAEAAFQAGRSDEAATLFARLQPDATATARRFIDQRTTVIGIERALAAGRTVELLPKSGLAGWTVLIGNWEVESDGALRVTSENLGFLLNCDARVGPDFELSADIEIVSTSNDQFQAGLVFGQPSWWTREWTSFRIKRTSHEGEVAYFSRHFEAPRQSHKMPMPRRAHVVVRAWKGHLDARVNGVTVASDYVPEWDWERGPEAKVGFGAYIDDNRVVVRYRKVTLRRLTSAPKR